MREALGIEAEEMTARGRAPESPQRRCWVPTLLIMMKIHRPSDFALAFHAGYVGGDESRSVAADYLRQRPDGRNHGRRRMSAHGVAAIVEIKNMRSHAVNERGAESVGPAVVAEDQGAALSCG